MARAIVERPYAYRLRSATERPYRSASTIRALVARPYASRSTPRRISVRPYGHLVIARTLTSRPYDLMAGPRCVTVRPYGFLVATARAVVERPYAITDVLRARLVTARIYGHTEVEGMVSGFVESVMIGVLTIDPLSVDISWGRSEYAMTATIQLVDAADYQLFARGEVVMISLFGDDYAVLVESKSRRRAHGSGWSYTINCLSPAAQLDAPHAETVSGELTGMASALAGGLAGSITLQWNTVDWYLPASTWIAADQTPLELLRTLAAASGAILISDPDGSLTVEAAYPVAVPKWMEVVPSVVLSEVLDIYEASDEDDHRPGYNRYLIGDQMTSSESLRIEDESISDAVHNLSIYQTPWSDDFDLRHTGGDWVFLESLGIEERPVTETVEFISGEGRTQYPIYGVVSLAWGQVNLGTITTSEEGQLVASIDGESLLEITYTTRCRRWIARNSAVESVQFVAEEVAA